MNSFTLKYNSAIHSISIEKNILAKIPDLLFDSTPTNKVFAVVDKNVYKLNKKSINLLLKNLNCKKDFYLLDAEESKKSPEELIQIFKKLVKSKALKDTILLSIGGGITGDIAGFAASVYLRGIKHVIIPTTLLSMVDSSVGGKNGVNFGSLKNILGTITQPHFTAIDTNFLSTLPAKHYFSGLGEVIKYGFFEEELFDAISFSFDKIFSRDEETLSGIINRCLQIKGAVVTKDEKETELRKILNFGHTYAHAFEAYLKFKIPHGQAVILGMISAIILSKNIGLLSQEKSEKMLAIFDNVPDIKLVKELKADKCAEIMYFDKKNKKDKIYPILIKDFGEFVLNYSVDFETIVETIKALKSFKTNNAKVVAL